MDGKVVKTRMISAGSVDGLVEASKMSRVTGGVGNEIMCAIYRIGMEVRHDCHPLSITCCPVQDNADQLSWQLRTLSGASCSPIDDINHIRRAQMS